MTDPDVIVVGAGHNGLVASIVLARAGLKVLVLEQKPVPGGACRTETPFAKAPRLGTSTGAYLLGLAPPELLAELELDLPLKRRDPHYFLPTQKRGYVLFGYDEAATKRQMIDFFSQRDHDAHVALNDEIAKIRDDVAPTWMREPLSIEETAERFVRAELRTAFVDLCRGSIRAYLDRFGFQSDLIKAMYAVTDAFSGSDACFDTPGSGMNFLAHNMCRLPGAGGTWMIVDGGMGTVTKKLAARAEAMGVTILTDAKVARVLTTAGHVSGVALANGETIDAKAVVSGADPFTARDLVDPSVFDATLAARVDALRRDGTTFKLNLAMKGLPTFTCLPEDRGQFGPTIHLLPEDDVIGSLERAHAEAMRGELPEFPSIEWYFHTPIDPSLRDAEGHHNAALFVQWVPRKLADGTSWSDRESKYAAHLLSICDRFAPGTSDLVVDMFPLSPEGIERHFGIRYGHIQHVDNGFGFTDRVPYRFGVPGYYACGASTHPGGGVIGCGGYVAAKIVVDDLR